MKHLTFLFFACLLCTSHLVAQDKYIEVNNIRYRIITEADGAATFGTVSVAPSEYDDYEGDMEIPMTVKDSDEEFAESYRVIGIDDGAFRKSNIKSIKIPSSIESIGNYAFERSTLKVIALPVGNLKIIGNHSFSNTPIEEINLPVNVKEIRRCAFSNCKDLVKVVLKDGVLSIGDSAFFQCSKLRECHIPSLLTKIEDYSFCGCVNLQDIVLGDKIKLIGENAFAFCASLRTLDLPLSIRIIKNYAFAHSGVKDLIIPENVKEICLGTFYNSQLRNIKLPENLETIEKWAFYGTNIYSINIPKNTKIKEGGLLGAKIQNDDFDSKNTKTSKIMSTLTFNESEIEFLSIADSNPLEVMKEKRVRMGNYIFLILSEPDERNKYGKLKLDRWDFTVTGNISIPDAIEIKSEKSILHYLITAIGREAFSIRENDNLFNEQPEIKSVKVGKTIELYPGAFAYSNVQIVDLPDITLPRELFFNSSIKEVKLTAKMVSIPSRCFSGCKMLKSIIIPSTVKIIEEYAFSDTSIESIEFADGIKIIGYCAFSGCKNIKTVTIPSTVDIIKGSAFSGCTNLSTVNLKEGLIEIGNESFKHCPIEYLIIPKSVQKVGYGAFDGTKTVWIQCDINHFGNEVFNKDTLLWYRLDVPLSGNPKKLGLTNLKK